MDFRGKLCTLYPISWQGAAVAPKQVDFNAVAGPIVFGAIAAVYGLYLLGRVPKSNP